MPRALHRAADERATCKASAAMGAVIVKGGVTIIRPGDNNSFTGEVNEFHLVCFEFAPPGHHYIAMLFTKIFFLPFARMCVSYVDADLVPTDQCATHPAGD